MKKLIFALLVLAAVPMLAQNSDKYISVGQIPSEQKMINNITQRTLEALRVIVVGDSAFKNDTIVVKPNSGYFAVQDSWNWARYSGGYTDTTSAAGDTVTPTNVSEWWRFTIATDDTIQFSSSSTFPSTDDKILLPGGTYTSEKLNVVYFPKIYYKVVGSGTPNVRIFWEGF